MLRCLSRNAANIAHIWFVYVHLVIYCRVRIIKCGLASLDHNKAGMSNIRSNNGLLCFCLSAKMINVAVLVNCSAHFWVDRVIIGEWGWKIALNWPKWKMERSTFRLNSQCVFTYFKRRGCCRFRFRNKAEESRTLYEISRLFLWRDICRIQN